MPRRGAHAHPEQDASYIYIPGDGYACSPEAAAVTEDEWLDAFGIDESDSSEAVEESATRAKTEYEWPF